MENLNNQTGEQIHTHEHLHDPQEKKRQLNRLSRIIGHLNYVKRMIENDEDCADVLMQIAATISTFTSRSKTGSVFIMKGSHRPPSLCTS